jgi:conjugative relaxase-like TrwC/TraI family protein
MLRIVQNSSAAGAKSYYSTADYYTEAQELAGVWRGKASARLGLAGEIAKHDWDALCDNRHPATGEVLTLRQKDNRRIGYDFNFHCPKSVSLLHGLTGDDRIKEAFRAAVDETMCDLEAEVKTRVRKGGKNEDRTTGNMVYGEFIHLTARPVNGVPDPHLHAHCFVFNTTWDVEESRWKAIQVAGIKRDAPYFEAVFHSRLARNLAELGVPVERTAKGWELQGIPDSAIEKFSRRTALIEELAKERGITDPEAKGELGAKTRERKQKALSQTELRSEWLSRLDPEELASVMGVADHVGEARLAEDGRTAGSAVMLAIDHCFERSSVSPERRVLAEAMKRSYGAASPNSVKHVLDGCDLISAERADGRLVTTRGVLAEERRMIAFARDGRGTCARLGTGPHVFKRDWLNEGQRRAVQHVLDSRDRVILIRGAAGVGKTAMMQEAADAIGTNGKCVFAFAPSANASRGVLRAEGFTEADTVARLLLDERLQESIHGQVIWIDEAGLLGTRMMGRVFDLADRLDARVILCGDRKQHGSVERGAALRLLETETGVHSAEIREIQRQKGEYREAVRALSEGDVEAGIRRLDRLGWVRELPDDERYGAMAEDYVTATEARKSVLVVSPTHAEGATITAEIRSRLKQTGELSTKERTLPLLENANFTRADRTDRRCYSKGQVLVFHQNARGFAKGQRLIVGEDPLPLDQADRFEVYQPGTIPIAAGDTIRITRGGTTVDGRHSLNNGALYTVKKLTRSGDLVLTNGWRIAHDYGHIAHGYVVTSHASQGKTVDRVLIGQSTQSYGAASREQAYVSISRGREQATIYTDDREALLEAVSRSDDRLSATELAAERDVHDYAAVAMRIAEMRAEPAMSGLAPTREERSYER